jgi:hypothetical protein
MNGGVEIWLDKFITYQQKVKIVGDGLLGRKSCLVSLK